MQTLSLNLRRCLAVSSGALFASAIALGTLSARAAVPSKTVALPAAPTSIDLKNDIASATPSKASFEPLFTRWEAKYGSRVVNPLLEISRDARASDPQRYIGIMGVARLGGKEAAPLLVPFLKDSSWMIRAATLRALSALDKADTASSVLPLLRDPALVVRMEAVAAIESLFFEGNYRDGKALWVPQKALRALAALKATDVAPKLKPLLDRADDLEILTQTVHTLEALQGRKLAPSLPIRLQAAEWKRALSAKR
jgi:HEAT repeat protein